LQVASPNIASHLTKYGQSPQQILPAAKPNIASRHTKYCQSRTKHGQSPHQILSVATPNTASRHTKYYQSPHHMLPVASPNMCSVKQHDIKYLQIVTKRRAGIILKADSRLRRHYCLPPEKVCNDKWGNFSVQGTHNP
jgi:hypothetical protein